METGARLQVMTDEQRYLMSCFGVQNIVGSTKGGDRMCIGITLLPYVEALAGKTIAK